MLRNPAIFNDSDTVENIIAPYWSDIDINSEGSVTYEVYTNLTNPSIIHKVNDFIQQREQKEFSGIWMLVAEWNSVQKGIMTYMCMFMHVNM